MKFIKFWKEYFFKPLMPWNPKKIRKEYEKELEEIERLSKRRKSPNKVPWYPWAYYCVAITDYTKYQWGN